MHRSARLRLSGFGLRLCGAALLVALPFYLLVRGALLARAVWGWNAWLAVLFGAALAGAAASGTAWWTQRKLGLRISFGALATAVLPAVAVFCSLSLVHLARHNAKTPEIQSAWTELHPALRLAVATLRLLDGHIVLTEIDRNPGSYAEMRLPRPVNSYHYLQADGTVHAIDLRTDGRGALRNGLVQLYFEVLGFETMRHIGTADHLHVRMPEVPS